MSPPTRDLASSLRHNVGPPSSSQRFSDGAPPHRHTSAEAATAHAYSPAPAPRKAPSAAAATTIATVHSRSSLFPIGCSRSRRPPHPPPPLPPTEPRLSPATDADGAEVVSSLCRRFPALLLVEEIIPGKQLWIPNSGMLYWSCAAPRDKHEMEKRRILYHEKKLSLLVLM
uniref:Uncharacterized protein n=1 Tax=Oryza glumipatula TaxID=40148 RepID=A0A0E0AL03_9ORYZ